MKIFTIGFTKKDAKTFFELLQKNKIDLLLDIRLNNVSQLAGFAKGNDLGYFINEILNAKYIHDTRFAPTKELLDSYRDKSINWLEYEKEFNKIIEDRRIVDIFQDNYYKNYERVCLLCSESEADKCHRRLIAEYLKENLSDIEIIHI